MYAYLPDHNYEFLNKNSSQINLLRIILNNYLDQNLSYLEKKYYFSDDKKPYR